MPFCEKLVFWALEWHMCGIESCYVGVLSHYRRPLAGDPGNVTRTHTDTGMSLKWVKFNISNKPSLWDGIYGAPNKTDLFASSGCFVSANPNADKPGDSVADCEDILADVNLSAPGMPKWAFGMRDKKLCTTAWHWGGETEVVPVSLFLKTIGTPQSSLCPSASTRLQSNINSGLSPPVSITRLHRRTGGFVLISIPTNAIGIQ